jgi:hypothetical protein
MLRAFADVRPAGERLFPIIGFGASLGAVFGSIVAGILIKPFGVYQLMLVGAVGLLLQLQVTSYVDHREAVKYFGVGVSVCILPVLSVVSYSLMAFVPNLGFVLAGKVSEKSTDYSLNNNREEPAVPPLHARRNTAPSSATLVFVGTTILGLADTGFAEVNIALAALGLMLAIIVGRRYARLSESSAATKRAVAS